MKTFDLLVFRERTIHQHARQKIFYQEIAIK